MYKAEKQFALIFSFFLLITRMVTVNAEVVSLNYACNQPLLINITENLADEDIVIYKENGVISNCLQENIITELTDNKVIIDMEITETHITMLLSDGQSCYVKVATWCAEAGTYHHIETKSLPTTSYLDLYHNSGNILLSISFTPESADEDDEIDFFLTFRKCEGVWMLVNFTDGQTLCGELVDGMYILTDYYDPECIYSTTIYGIPLNEFDINDFYEKVDWNNYLDYTEE